MGLFKKKGPEIIDLTELSKKGTLQRSRAIAERQKANSANENKIIDLSAMQTSQASSSSSDSAFSLLSNLASAASTTPESSSSFYPSASQSSSADFQTLKIKLEDIEYKLERFIERLEKIEEKMLASTQ